MFVDASAIVAILAGEPDAARFSDAIEAAEAPCTSGIALIDASLVLAARAGLPAGRINARIEELLVEARIGIVAVDQEVARIAIAAHERFGPGSGRTSPLDYGGCLAYAAARALGVPVLCKDGPLAATDIERAS